MAVGDEDTDRTLPLHSEQLDVSTRKRVTARVSVSTVNRLREELVDRPLGREHVEIERVPIGSPVSEPPAVRSEGDTVVIPVVEEVIVVERRLMLREEVRVRRVRTIARHRETIGLREQDVVVRRTPEPEDPDRIMPEQQETSHGK